MTLFGMGQRGWSVLSLNAGGWLIVAGIACAFKVDFAPGMGLVALGALGASVGLCGLFDTWHDPVRREADIWEENWNGYWSPYCPVHQDRICGTISPKCPNVRHRIGV